jgi:plasmid maintenance system antidote protein VapI
VTNYKKVLLKLPAETADELIVAYGTGNRALLLSYVVALREGGWTFESMAQPLGISRERVRQLYNEVLPYETGLALAEAQRVGFVVPERPIREEKAKHTPKKLSPEALERLQHLQPRAQLVRSNSARFRAEAEEFVQLLNKQREAGVTIYQMAKALGVTHAAIRSRLVRYGYLNTSSDAKAYTPIRTTNRV